MTHRLLARSFMNTYIDMVSRLEQVADRTEMIPDKQYSLEHKILIMQLLSRVMGSHKLCILGFYSYIIKRAVPSPCRQGVLTFP